MQDKRQFQYFWTGVVKPDRKYDATDMRQRDAAAEAARRDTGGTVVSINRRGLVLIVTVVR